MGFLFSSLWRVISSTAAPWSKEQREELRQDIRRITVPDSKGVVNGNIVLFGPISSGKSSFINSLRSIEKGRMAQDVQAGNAETSLTKKFTRYTFDSYNVSDTMGLSVEHGLRIDDVTHILRGNMPTNYQFKPETPFTRESQGFNDNPTNADIVHCVVFCIGADMITSELPPGLLRKCQQLLNTVRDEGVPRIVVLTKIDKISKSVEKDLTQTFCNAYVENVVKMASEMLDIEEVFIHPVNNLTKRHPTTGSSILHLHALKHAAAFSQDYIQRLPDQE